MPSAPGRRFRIAGCPSAFRGRLDCWRPPPSRADPPALPSFDSGATRLRGDSARRAGRRRTRRGPRSEEHTSELQSPCNLVCRLLLEKKKHTSLDTVPPPRNTYTHDVHQICVFTLYAFTGRATVLRSGAAFALTTPNSVQISPVAHIP